MDQNAALVHGFQQKKRLNDLFTSAQRQIEGIHMEENIFAKAVDELGLEVYTKDALNKFKLDLREKYINKKIEKENLEKAEQDILTLKHIIVKNYDGSLSDVWVRKSQEKLEKANKDTIEKARRKGSKDKVKRKSKGKRLKSDKRKRKAKGLNTAARRKLAKTGGAMKGGEFPIRNKKDLMNALHDMGRTKLPKKSVARHIVKRAQKLGLSKKLNPDWRKKYGV